MARQKINRNNTIKILLVDDSRIWRNVMRECLGNYKDMQVIGECSDGQEVGKFLADNTVDIVIMDIKMKRMSGMHATKLVKQNYPNAKVIALTGLSEDIYKDTMLRLGAAGFMVKGQASIQEIIQSIRTVHHGSLIKT